MIVTTETVAPDPWSAWDRIDDHLAMTLDTRLAARRADALRRRRVARQVAEIRERRRLAAGQGKAATAEPTTAEPTVEPA